MPKSPSKANLPMLARKTGNASVDNAAPSLPKVAAIPCPRALYCVGYSSTGYTYVVVFGP